MKNNELSGNLLSDFDDCVKKSFSRRVFSIKEWVFDSNAMTKNNLCCI